MKKKLLALMLTMGVSVSLVACGSSSYSSKADFYEAPAATAEMADYDYAETEEMVAYDANDAGTSVTRSETATTSNRKLIRNVSLTVETKEFDKLVSNLDKQIKDLGGYIEDMDGYYGSKYSSYRSSKSATIVARIPAASLDGFINSIGDTSNITNRSESVRDVTLEYVDLDSHKRMLMEEQDRLLEFLEEAETIEDIMSIEDRITEIKYQIDSMESQIRTYDNKVDYSTVTLNIEEVIDYTEPVTVEPELTPAERMVDGLAKNFKSVLVGLREFGIWLVINIPYFILLGLVAVVVIVIVKASNKRSKARLEKRKVAKEAAEAAAKIAKDNAAKEVVAKETVEETVNETTEAETGKEE